MVDVVVVKNSRPLRIFKMNCFSSEGSNTLRQDRNLSMIQMYRIFDWMCGCIKSYFYNKKFRLNIKKK